MIDLSGNDSISFNPTTADIPALTAATAHGLLKPFCVCDQSCGFFDRFDVFVFHMIDRNDLTVLYDERIVFFDDT